MSGQNPYSQLFKSELRAAVKSARSALGRSFEQKGFGANRAKAYYDIASTLRREAQRISDGGFVTPTHGQTYQRLLESAKLLESQAEITTQSGEAGVGAVLGNLNAFQRGRSSGNYNLGLEQFSWEIVHGTLSFFELVAGVGNLSAFGQISPNSIKAVDGIVWQSKNLIDVFPGTGLGIDYTILSPKSLVWQTAYSSTAVRLSLQDRSFNALDYGRNGGFAVAAAYANLSVQQHLGNSPESFGFSALDIAGYSGGSITGIISGLEYFNDVTPNVHPFAIRVWASLLRDCAGEARGCVA